MRKFDRERRVPFRDWKPVMSEFAAPPSPQNEVRPHNGLRPVSPELSQMLQKEPKQFSHYFKDVSNLQEVDVYRVIRLFGVTDPALAHAVKKLMVAGGRGAGKSQEQDVREAIASCQRFLTMNEEDARDPKVFTQQAAITIAEASKRAGFEEAQKIYMGCEVKNLTMEDIVKIAEQRGIDVCMELNNGPDGSTDTIYIRGKKPRKMPSDVKRSLAARRKKR